MEATRFLKLVIVMLLLINLGTLSFLWLGRRDDHIHTGGERPHGPARFLERELSLTEDQRMQYKAMREVHHAEMLELRKQAAGYRAQINLVLKAETPDSIKIERFSDSIGYCQRNAEVITFYHFRDLRAICKPDQQAKFDRVINEAIQMLSPEK